MYYGAGLSGRALVLMWTAADLHGFLSDRMDPGTGSADLKLGIVKTLSCVFGDLITKARGRLDMTDRFCSDPTNNVFFTQRKTELNVSHVPNFEKAQNLS